jgi:uncharacterized small protein (DUF1192 family)
MTVEEHLRVIIGDLVLRVAQLSATVDDLKAQLAEKDDAAPQRD